MKVILKSRPEYIPSSSDERCREDQMEGPDGQQLIEFAGRTCYDSFGAGRSSEDYAENILEVGHGSVTEHAQYTFLIQGVSRNLMAELTRHRISFSIRSTRFCDETETNVILHPFLVEIFGQYPDLAKRFWEWVNAGRGLYVEVVEAIQNHLTERGVNKHDARKQARGAARACLSSALETEIVMSANVRFLRHIVEMRASAQADAEIRVLADGLYALMRNELPAYFSDYSKIFPDDGIGYGLLTEHKKI